jgi:hypothetical protein
VFLLTTITLIHGQQPVEMASLRSEMKLRWQRTSPAPGETEGPVLYQLLFSATGTPGTIARFDTNPRHLTNSDIVDSGGIVAIGGLAIDAATGIVTFAGGQTFPGLGTITEVKAGTGLIGGGTHGSVSLNIADRGVTARQISSGAVSDGMLLTSDGEGGSGWQTLSGWSLYGNFNTNPGISHLGTNDQIPLELWVNNLRTLRLEPGTTSPNLIGGIYGNSAIPASVMTGISGAVIAGGGDAGDGIFTDFNNVTDDFGTVGGGAANRAGRFAGTTAKPYATVSGGLGNAAGGQQSFVGGGGSNLANADNSTIAGGSHNFVGGLASLAFVGGGEHHLAMASGAFVGGGQHNTASGIDAVVGGGHNNTANSADDDPPSPIVASFVGGGDTNTASATGAVVGGGSNNRASGRFSAVLGGITNTASGIASTVAGGTSNTASGNNSFAAGTRANTNSHSGSFVWGDGSGSSDVTPTADDQFVARASGGVVFYSSPDLSAGVQLAAGGGSWSSVSDRNVKDHFASVDTKVLLAHVLALPITTWNYKAQDTSIRHIGPMAQDFFAAFKVGEDDKHITGIDEGGVALAAIQGLNQKLEQELGQLRAELQSKDAQLAAQQKQIDQLAVQLAAQTQLTGQFNSELARQQAMQRDQLISLREQITKLGKQARNTDDATVAESSNQRIAPPVTFNPTSK